MSTAMTFTGRQRRRQTRRSVRVVDRIARSLIAIGGIGTVIVVTTVCVFLVWVVVPLFMPARLGEPRKLSAALPAGDAIHLEMDDYRLLGWAMSAGGVLRVFRLDSGEVVSERALFPDSTPTAWSFAVGGREALCGFADGSIRTIRLGFWTTFPAEADLPESLRQMTAQKPVAMDGGLLTRTSQGQLRLQTVKAAVSDPLIAPGGARVERVDSSSRPMGRVCCWLDAEGKLKLHAIRRRVDLARKASDSSVFDATLPDLPASDRGLPDYLLLAGAADNLYAIWSDGHLVRYDLRHIDKPRIAEETDLVPENGELVTAVQFLPGKTTFAIGDTLGRVRAWFPVKAAEARTIDGTVLAIGHESSAAEAPVSALGSCARARLLAVGYADGGMRVFQVTTDRQLVASSPAAAEPLRLMAVAPKGDGVLAVAPPALVEWPLTVGFPEVSLSALFRPLWYEGYDEPRHVWQSSGGADDFEPKLGMIPLVFGTVKATLYSLLFAVPLALFSAIYTSEFLHARAKARIKPAIEMMASLPSVVLGFVAALVIAPFVEVVIPTVLVGIVVVPLTFLLAAHLWQLLPARAALLLARWRFAFICATLPVGVLLAVPLGPVVERALFAGDLRSWLDGQAGTSVGGWLVMFLPFSALATALFLSRRVNPMLRRALRGAGRGRQAIVELFKFIAAATVIVAGALAAALLLDSLHLDPRGLVLQSYVQRNALVVGFVMGFAIIPLIYTIADDALSTVPSHLRSASLGAGATPWQTAVRVIVPTAMSGLFSAVMIGLGRAVGETMIVLMAAGNTPILDWNIFNGFQTLSASIATELPEAVQGSAHYRTLFIAALALFAMTFVVNTVAEGVRLRFRRRAYEL
jgi:phosphate transport system permease protein